MWPRLQRIGAPGNRSTSFERPGFWVFRIPAGRSEEHTSELQSQSNLVCRLLLEKKKNIQTHFVPDAWLLLVMLTVASHVSAIITSLDMLGDQRWIFPCFLRALNSFVFLTDVNEE